MVQTNAMLGKVRSDLAQFQKPTAPLFSVIVPIYNVERYLKQAIDSVLQQDFYNYELILVNDGSTDSSGDIAYQYSKKYPHIQLISQPNGGLSAARNAGMKLAKGEYLMFLDSDDYWRGTTILSDIAKLIEENHQPDLVLNSFKYIFPTKEESNLIRVNDLANNVEKDLPKLVAKKLYSFSAWTKIVKNQVVKEYSLFFPVGRNFEDQLWSTQLAKYINSYAIYYNDFYMYRSQREGSITQYVTEKNMDDLFYISDACYQELLVLSNKNGIYKGIATLLTRYMEDVIGSYRVCSEKNKLRFKMQYDNFILSQEHLSKILTEIKI